MSDASRWKCDRKKACSSFKVSGEDLSNCAIVSWCVWADGTSLGFDGDGGSAAATWALVRFKPVGLSNRLPASWFSSVRILGPPQLLHFPTLLAVVLLLLALHDLDAVRQFQKGVGDVLGGVSILVVVVCTRGSVDGVWAVAAGGGRPVRRCLVGVRKGSLVPWNASLGLVRAADVAAGSRSYPPLRPLIRGEASNAVIEKAGCKSSQVFSAPSMSLHCFWPPWPSVGHARRLAEPLSWSRTLRRAFTPASNSPFT